MRLRGTTGTKSSTDGSWLGATGFYKRDDDKDGWGNGEVIADFAFYDYDGNYYLDNAEADGYEWCEVAGCGDEVMGSGEVKKGGGGGIGASGGM